MTTQDFHLHDGRKGSALGIRVIPRATRNEIVEILHDGTIRVRLKAAPREKEINQTLADFLASVLDIPRERIEVVGGSGGRDKLVSVLDMDASEAQQKIIQNLA
ncbi:MAG: DUF167 domain-containing protein [Anaerolineales bacterium]|nr:DUF167 domain-containing protein [Chloroflexota bacterium]MBL6982394.1 DUF167 domain-containing protein [Anaerolineales bacterium]